MNLEPLSSGANPAPSDSLGNLAQVARSKQLRTARIILIIVGSLTLVINAVVFAMAPGMADDVIAAEVTKARSQGLQIDEAKVAEARSRLTAVLRVIDSAYAATGVLFILFGIAIYIKPVPITITSLVIYVGSHAVVGFFSPVALLNGLLVKILIIVSLFKAIQSAIAYERERSASSTAPPPVDPFDAGMEFSG